MSLPVSLSNGARAVVDAVTDVGLGELSTDPGDQRGEVRVVGERQQRTLQWGDDGREGEECALLVSFPHLRQCTFTTPDYIQRPNLEVMFEYRVHDTADPERGLHDAGDELLHVECFLVFLHTDHLFGQLDLLSLHFQISRTSGLQFSLNCRDLIQAKAS